MLGLISPSPLLPTHAFPGQSIQLPQLLPSPVSLRILTNNHGNMVLGRATAMRPRRLCIAAIQLFEGFYFAHLLRKGGPVGHLVILWDHDRPGFVVLGVHLLYLWITGQMLLILRLMRIVAIIERKSLIKLWVSTNNFGLVRLRVLQRVIKRRILSFLKIPKFVMAGVEILLL